MLPTTQDTQKMYNLIMSRDQHALSGVVAAALNVVISRQPNTDWCWWGSELQIELANTTSNVFEKLIGYSIDETELASYALKATSEEISINELECLYCKEPPSPLYLVVQENPLAEPFQHVCDPVNDPDFFNRLFRSDYREGFPTFEDFIESLTSVEIGNTAFNSNLATFTSLENAAFFTGNEDVIDGLDRFNMVGSIGNGFVIRIA